MVLVPWCISSTNVAVQPHVLVKWKTGDFMIALRHSIAETLAFSSDPNSTSTWKAKEPKTLD